jgi:Spy/CpxP family protein refolding chaperone
MVEGGRQKTHTECLTRIVGKQVEERPGGSAMMNTRTRTAVFAIALAMPVAMHAQRGMGPRTGQMGGNPVAPLIDMRRELNLSARQLTQLDSIERSLLQRNEALRGRLRARMDTVRPRTRPSSEEEIAAFRAQADSMRAVRQVMMRNDSTARAAAMSVLTDSQRVRVRERQAERRGFEAGRRTTMRGQRGFRDGRPGTMGPRMRGPGGRIGMDGPGLRQRGMRGPGGVGPQFDGRRGPVPDAEMRPMGRGFRRPFGAPGVGGDSLSQRRRPMDGMEMRPRMRRPPPDSAR